MLASDRADADAAEREDAGLDRGLAHELDDLGHVDAVVELAEYSIVKCGMAVSLPMCFWRQAK